MPILRGRIRPEGALATVTIGPSLFAVESGAADAARTIRVQAIFDTGADITVLQEGVAERVGLFPHDVIDVAGMHGSTASCHVYDVHLTFPDAGIVFPNLTVVESRTTSSAHGQVLIGRSVLWKGVFVYDGLRHTYSFETPDPAATS
ncbi:MAG: aspartyl protease family protein [Planctomycetota bacterium]